jgi:Predicted ATPase (AAA+ superfamily)
VLFDLAPKASKRDFYDFEAELEQLYKFYLSARVVAVSGPRRTGKTSLILTFLNEYRVPSVFIDCRRVALSPYGVSFRGFVEELTRALNSFLERLRGRAERLLELLKSVRGVEVDLAMARVALGWGRKKRPSLVELLERVNRFASEEGVRVALVLDELQELQPLNIDFSKLLAYAYDHLANTVVIVTGSQIGLLYDMLGVDDPESPLYGRAVAEVSMRRLLRDEAVEFLEKGFAELGVEVEKSVIEEAVNTLDGVIGWLTYFGWSYANGVRSLGEVLDMAAKQEAEELKRFLAKTRSERRYREILKAIASGKSKWSEIKRALEVAEGIEIDDSNFSDLLKKLIKAGFIEKRGEVYTAPDPITLRAIEKHL